jgi:hypothetical protein
MDARVGSDEPLVAMYKVRMWRGYVQHRHHAMNVIMKSGKAAAKNT